MTKYEYCAALAWAKKQPDAEYQLKMVGAFASAEFGKPRPDKPWKERFEEFCKKKGKEKK